jgi:antitoxin component of RelBE/YafQ-DinJ toxin-antitoxin module
MKAAGMRIRIEPALRDEFVQVCRNKDTTASEVLRAFMKGYIQREGSGRQSELFLRSGQSSPAR